jgi:hypothetical protein
VLFHADDVGMCHGSNQAFLELNSAQIVRTGSLMPPCPWAPEMLLHCRKNPRLDVGVHLTLTSEWAGYRWGPISTRDPASGLLDQEGYFWRRVDSLQRNLQISAAVREMREQIEWVAAAGIDFTHLDTHMGAAIIPELLEAYVNLGFDYQVPVLLPRQIDDYARSLGLVGPNEQAWLDFTGSVEARGMPLVDWFRITPGYHVEDGDGGRAALYEEILAKLPPGITYFSLHPNRPGDIETIVPERAYWRTFENDYFRSQRLADFLQRQRIIPIGYREIRERMRRP